MRLPVSKLQSLSYHGEKMKEYEPERPESVAQLKGMPSAAGGAHDGERRNNFFQGLRHSWGML
ncbi:MAG TPA: hypothetical protein VGZ73_24970 [Bryobacteraceae bacterium]|jgi:hypothetical protein|nr:hypothetical protein [Bryobacteraceae bacterium]